jgi:positive phototaxis protein PixI
MLSSSNIETELKQEEAKYLKLHLASNFQGLLPMTSIQEVIVIPKQRITFIPNMANYIVGLINQRNHVFWVVDLCLFLGLSNHPKNYREYHIAVIKVNDISLGLMVENIEGIIRIPLTEIKINFETIYENLKLYINGCISGEDNNSNAYIFNVDVINHNLLLEIKR